MRALPTLLTIALLIAAAVPASAAHPKHARHAAHRGHAHAAKAASASSGPTSIGTWDQWSAATHTEGGQLVCYAFARAAAPGGSDLLTVTQRPSSRDAVAITAGYAYPKDAAVDVQVAGRTLPFYAAGGSAFARSGRAAVAAFQRGREVRVRAPAAARGGQAVNTFSLAGFPAAYAAVNKRCPR